MKRRRTNTRKRRRRRRRKTRLDSDRCITGDESEDFTGNRCVEKERERERERKEAVFLRDGDYRGRLRCSRR